MAINDIKTIKEILEIIKHKVGMVEMRQATQSSQISVMKDQQSVINEKLDEMKETQEDHTKRLEALAVDSEQLLMDIKGIRDKEGMAHSRNKREIDEIKNHLDLPLMADIPEV